MKSNFFFFFCIIWEFGPISPCRPHPMTWAWPRDPPIGPDPPIPLLASCASPVCSTYWSPAGAIVVPYELPRSAPFAIGLLVLGFRRRRTTLRRMLWRRTTKSDFRPHSCLFYFFVFVASPPPTIIVLLFSSFSPALYGSWEGLVVCKVLLQGP